MNIFKTLKKDPLEYEFLPPALEIVESPPSPAKRLLIWLILVLVLFVFLWSFFGRVDEVAVARGKIIPDGRIKVLQPLETSVIKVINVKEGEKVRAGQVLMEFDPTIKLADLESAEKALDINVLNKRRLLAELNNQNKWEKHGSEVFGIQSMLKNAREAEYRAKEDALKLVSSQKEDELKSAEAILIKLKKTYDILKEQEPGYKQLYEGGYISKISFQEKEVKLASAEQDFESQQKIVERAKNDLAEKQKQLEALLKEKDRNILSDLVNEEKSLAITKGEVRKAKRRLELERLVSPVDGTIHGVSSYTVGGVVKEAQTAITVVPEGTPLVVEAMALNKDIGFIEMGQEAEIKLDTFPFQKYGSIKGKVVWISPDAFDDEKLGPVYKINVLMERTSLFVNTKDVSLSPGMTLSAEVKTGKRRIIEFFLSPLMKYARESLTLR